jgi:hypothetical protein
VRNQSVQLLIKEHSTAARFLVLLEYWQFLILMTIETSGIMASVMLGTPQGGVCTKLLEKTISTDSLRSVQTLQLLCNGLQRDASAKA